MELHELEDLHDKIAYHSELIETNLSLLGELLDSYEIDSGFIQDSIASLGTAFKEFEDKYHTDRDALTRGEE